MTEAVTGASRRLELWKRMTSPGSGRRARYMGFASLVLAFVGAFGCNPEAGEARALGDACAEGAADACDELGQRVQKGEHVLRDWRRAAELYALACDRGEPQGCVRLARMHVDDAAEDSGLAHEPVREESRADARRWGWRIGTGPA
jgi:TPR repeat protein